MVKVLVHDFAGHPFQAELSRALAARLDGVVHASCSGVTTGQGDLRRRPGDPAGLRFVDVGTEPFERYSPLARVRSELRYGRRLARLVRQERPDVVLSANTPLLAQARLWRAARRVGTRRTYWVQDFLGRGTRQVLQARSPLLGHTVGRAFEALETALLRRSDGIVVIADDFRDELRRRRVPADRATVVENWAPLDEIARAPKDTPWSRRHGLADRPVALYAGTLGLKHDPAHLVALAEALRGTDGVLVVISEGRGRDALEARRAEGDLDDALLLLDYVAYDELPLALGAADVALVLLEAEAGTFSVPSKVLTYLAAGRAVVGAIPAENLAARTIARADAGIVVTPGDHDGFARAVTDLLADEGRRQHAAEAARAYAEATFAIDAVCARFLDALGATPDPPTPASLDAPLPGAAAP